MLLLGVLTPEQVREERSRSAALVQHAATGPDGEMEGAPVALLEAAAAGLSVLATRHAGIPDVGLDGETGLLVGERDIDGMAVQMCRILEKADETRAMGEAGRQRTREHSRMTRSMGDLNDVIARVIAGENENAGSAISGLVVGDWR